VGDEQSGEATFAHERLRADRLAGPEKMEAFLRERIAQYTAMGQRKGLGKK
jgi:hypothetical protein